MPWACVAFVLTCLSSVLGSLRDRLGWSLLTGDPIAYPEKATGLLDKLLEPIRGQKVVRYRDQYFFEPTPVTQKYKSLIIAAETAQCLELILQAHTAPCGEHLKFSYKTQQRCY
jgi:hypothetical protein